MVNVTDSDAYAETSGKSWAEPPLVWLKNSAECHAASR
jgi:hypothetical protein